MNFSSFAKPSYLFAGAGVTGTSAVGIVGINNYVEGNRTGQDKLTRRGFSRQNSQFETFKTSFNTREQVNTDSTAKNRLSLKTGDCFQKFFPGVNDPGMPPSTSDSSITSPTFNVKSHADPIGCQVIKYSEKAASEASIKKAFIYKSDLTVKTENFGWSLSMASTNISIRTESDTTKLKLIEKQLVIELRVLFLEKKSSSWSIKKGYAWKRDIVHGNSLSQDFVIADPETKESWFTREKSYLSARPKEEDFTVTTPDANWTDKFYSGIWHVSTGSTGAHEIFNGYGSVGMWGLSLDSAGSVPKITNVFGRYESGKWTGIMTTTPAYLSSPYQPFKGKKGIWKSIDKYCEELSQARGLSPEELDNLRDLCYVKSDSIGLTINTHNPQPT